MNQGGHAALPFYPEFETPGLPSSGFAAGVASPRYSQGYWGARNRMGMLVETHSWKDYRTRTLATRDVLAAVLELAGRRAERVPVAAEPALDDAWAEPPAFDGCSTQGQASPRPQPIRIVRQHATTSQGARP